ncbi:MULTISPECIES: SRPBCC family protein [Methylocaldum]|jgi:mxaD protein|uniref:SRPBCC family protein n=2 Tax=Methylocaldum TaxID=73778 RepID=UPI00105F777C|nr:SRPBCC family protein [Methylocaldum sp. 14B]MDV3240295.1 SRPBCC family protein [Methylocaldum sp.]
MKMIVPALLTLGLAFSAGVSAHGPTPQKVVETVEIDRPIEKVWETVKEFGAVAQWNPAISKSEAQGGNKPGEKRTLTFPNGEQLVEELDFYDEKTYEYDYRLMEANVKALPASSYSAVLKLTPAGQGTKAEWKSRLYRGDTGNFPPDELNDEAAVQSMQALFKAGLENLKRIAESDH